MISKHSTDSMEEEEIHYWQHI